MALVGDPPAMGRICLLGTGNVRRMPDIVTPDIRVTQAGHDPPPGTVLVVGDINRFGRSLELIERRGVVDLEADIVAGAPKRPRTVHITNHLLLIRVAWTPVNLHTPKVPIRASLRHVRHVNQEPKYVVAAWYFPLVILRVHLNRQTDLVQVVETIGALPGRLRLGQSRKQQAREDGNDRDHQQQLNQIVQI